MPPFAADVECQVGRVANCCGGDVLTVTVRATVKPGASGDVLALWARDEAKRVALAEGGRRQLYDHRSFADDGRSVEAVAQYLTVP